MPAIRFFSMLQAGRRLDAITRIEDCDIALIGQLDEEGVKKTRKRFEDRLRFYGGGIGEQSSRPGSETESVGGAPPVIDAGSTQARDIFFEVFAAKKGLR